jgi:ABC-2 type transport system permease protein
MQRAVPKYWAIFKTQTTNSFAYAGDLASRSLSIVLFLWVFTQLWRATYSAIGQESIAGLTLRETLWYLMLAETIVLSKPRLARTIAEAVKDGSIAYLLNKPYNFLLYQASVGLGDSVLLLGFNALAGGTLVWIMVGPPPDPRGWPLVAATVMAAWFVDFCIAAMIGLSAFLTEEIAAFEWIYSKILFLLGGLLIPLDFFPDWLRAIAQVLPFAYTIYGPARFFVEPSPARFVTLFAGQMAWLLVLGLLLTFLYRRGVAWLSINGG